MPGRAQDPFVEYDARNDIGDRGTHSSGRAGFADASWTAATAKGVPPRRRGGDCGRAGIPQWRNSGIRHYSNQDSLPKTGMGEVIHANLPSNIQVTPYLHVRAPMPAFRSP